MSAVESAEQLPRSTYMHLHKQWIALVLLAQAISVVAQTPSGLPAHAVVIERATIPSAIHPDRELVLWMISPQRNDRGKYSDSNPYTCPDDTLGSYYAGPTRLSLLDTAEQRTINTVKITSDDEGDSFNIPYRILADFYYRVPGHRKGTEGKPALLAPLRDLNGDGLALEAAFFEAEACMGLATTLVGYSPKQDRAIQYEVELHVTEHEVVVGRGIVKTKTREERTFWPDYLFAEKPMSPGHWKYEIDYRGRGGTLDKYTVRYDPLQEKFIGELSTVTAPPEPR